MSAHFEITRSFQAPRELVFQAFAEPQHLQHWWGPEGWAFDIAQFEFRQGGVFLYSQTSPEGEVMWVKFVYDDIAAPERIVYNSYFANAEGDIARAPFLESWPLQIVYTFTFTEHEGSTTLTMTGVPVNATEEELSTFTASQEMAREGFGGTFNRLADYLPTI